MESPLSSLNVNPFPYAAYADPDVDPPFFVERKDEFSTLLDAAKYYLFSDSTRFHTLAPAVIVSGPSGAGKTYLLSMVYHRIVNLGLQRNSPNSSSPAPVRIFVRRPAESFLRTYKEQVFPDLRKVLTEAKPSIYKRWLISIVERTGEKGVLTEGTLEELRKDPEMIESLDKREIFRRDVLLQALDQDILNRAPKEDLQDFLTVFRHLGDTPLQHLALGWLGGMVLEPHDREALGVT